MSRVASRHQAPVTTGAFLFLVIARSEATKQSMVPQADKWIASLRSQ